MTAEEIKALPRTGDGVFDLSGVDGNIYQAAGKVYPVYAAFETEHNKKEGYPDILEQIRKLAQKLNEDYTFENAASFAEALIETIDRMSPEIYEYYRELIEMFRSVVKKSIGEYYHAENPQSGSFQKVSPEAEKQFRGAVKKACGMDVLLAEKYGRYC